MSSPNSPTLTLDVRARRSEQYIALLALGAGACGVALLSALDFWLACLTGGGYLALAGAGLRRAGWIGSRHRIVSLSWLADGRWLLTDCNQNSVTGQLSPDTRLGRHAVWLRWTAEPQGRRSMLLARGDVRENELRQLIVRLRIRSTERALPETAPRMRTIRELRRVYAQICRNSANFRLSGQSIRAVLGGRSRSGFRPAIGPRGNAGR